MVVAMVTTIAIAIGITGTTTTATTAPIAIIIGASTIARGRISASASVLPGATGIDTTITAAGTDRRPVFAHLALAVMRGVRFGARRRVGGATSATDEGGTSPGSMAVDQGASENSCRASTRVASLISTAHLPGSNIASLLSSITVVSREPGVTA